MATTLKTRKTKKPKIKTQAKIYESTQNIGSQGYKEPLATKEFIRQELVPIRVSQNWIRAALTVLFTAVGGLYVLLWGMKTDIHKLDKKIDRVEIGQKELNNKMEGMNNK